MGRRGAACFFMSRLLPPPARPGGGGLAVTNTFMCVDYQLLGLAAHLNHRGFLAGRWRISPRSTISSLGCLGLYLELQEMDDKDKSRPAPPAAISCKSASSVFRIGFGARLEGGAAAS
jgi:hypothetical protein